MVSERVRVFGEPIVRVENLRAYTHSRVLYNDINT